MSQKYKPDIVKGLKSFSKEISVAEIKKADALFPELIARRPRSAMATPFQLMATSYQDLAMVSFFEESDVTGFLKNMYQSSMLIIRSAHSVPTDHDTSKAASLFGPLLSNNKEVIHWFSQHVLFLCLHNKDGSIYYDDVQDHYFHDLCFHLALQGDWQWLKERCEKALATTLKQHKLRHIDYRFLLALANGDKPGMEAALAELLQPKVNRHRNNEMGNNGIETGLLAFWPTIMAKIAWLHGYEVEVDPDWVPKEWLPMTPLESYQPEPSYMQGFDMWQKFTALEESRCANPEVATPRPLGEEPLMARDLASKIQYK